MVNHRDCVAILFQAAAIGGLLYNRRKRMSAKVLARQRMT
jgi:hypothetical protein